MTDSEKTLLWIDDEIDLLKSHVRFLEEHGYSVSEVSNGTDALEMIRKKNFDLVLLDEMMPVMDGLEVLRKIKELRSELPVVMVTKNEAEELMDQAIGSQIDGYLTKPVNPSQILSVLKGIIDRKYITAEQLSRSWAQGFAELSGLIDERLDHEGWLDLHNRFCAWELKLDQMGYKDLTEMLRELKQEADRRFGRWIEKEYTGWIASPPGERPPLSMDLVDRWLLPLLEDRRPILFLVVDCLRLDQWLALEPLLSEHFNIRRDMYFSILPSATPYSRNAIFSGLTPVELERIHPDLWARGDEDEASSNRFERQFLLDLLKRRGVEISPDPKYVKVLDVVEVAEFERRVTDYSHRPLTAMVYNFVDILIHKRQSVEVLKEMLPDESAFRAVTRAWFGHSSLFRILQAYSDAGGTVLITSDHGSVRGKRGSKVIGDRQTSTSLRYKHGRNLQCDPKHALKIKNPEAWGVPLHGVNTDYIFAREDYYFVYPTNYHKYLELYNGSFQHGGLSLDEMALPVVTLTSKS